MRSVHKHSLIGGILAFIAWGLVVQHLPVLRYIGYAFTFGCFLSFAAISYATLTFSRPANTLSRPPVLPAVSASFLEPKTWSAEVSRYQSALVYKPLSLYDKSFVISQALDGLIGLALRDFVSSWYSGISQNQSFVNEVDTNIRGALAEIRDRILGEDIVDVVVTRIVPIITAHLRDCAQAEQVVKGRTLTRNITDSDELALAIAARYKDGKLHPAASLAYSDTKAVEQEHLRKLVVRIMPEITSPQLTGSRAVSVLIKEIVACAVLFPLLQLLKDPDTWNQIVENYGRTTLQDRKTVRRMRAALDQHTSPGPKTKSDQDLPKLRPNDSERAFERFVRSIRKIKTLSDARRFRSQVASQLKRESLVEGQDPVYLRRLEMAKRVLDQKISKMAIATGKLPGMAPQHDFRATGNVQNSRELSLVEVMHTASGLSYFMEYMDRQQKMSMVQFWIVVDGFRNPLEDDFGDDNTTDPSLRSWKDSDRIDIASISETYMARPEISVQSESKDAIRAFLVAGRKATNVQYSAARTAILATQSAVLEELQSQHFPQFKKSDLYFKFLASDEARTSIDTPRTSIDLIRPPSPLKPVKPTFQSPPASRSASYGLSKSKDLRRVALSSTDVRGLGTKKLFDDSDVIAGTEEQGQVNPLFDDGYDTDPLAHSTQSIGPESVNGDGIEQGEVIESMEAAMNSIMADKHDREPLFEEGDALFGSTSDHRSPHNLDSRNPSFEIPRTDSPVLDKIRPSIATLGLVNTSSRIGVFADNDLFPDEEKFIEDEYADHAVPEETEVKTDEIHEAAPGDLGLTEAISSLSMDIERLVAQEAVVDTLTRKAELVNNVAELRILGKSKASLQRETRRKELQRQQYIVQESDNSLYGKSNIRIKSVMVGREDDGHEFALYVIEVQRQAGDQLAAATWAIARRYSEFHDLHQRLRRRYPSTRNLEFPRRRMVMKLQKQFLHNRRVALENYLQHLLRMPDVCRSRELRSFLSQQAISPANGDHTTSETQDIVSRIYNSVSDGMDEFLGNVAVLDQLSVAGQNLISAATSQLGTGPPEIQPVVSGPVAEAEAELRAFEDKELEPFVKPICDIFLETFDLNKGNNWLRGRAVIVVLHQLLGGTVERKVRDLAKGLFQEDAMLRYIDLLKESMWPEGQFRKATERSGQDKTKTKEEAAIVLSTLLPDLAANVVGRSNAQSAAKRISGTMNNARLNQHLAYTILDEVVGILFDHRQRKG